MSIIQTLQSPPIWSPAYNPIIWMLESDQTTQYKFRYVFDVYLGTNPVPIRYKVPPNPEGKGLIDVSSLTQAEIYINKNLPMLSTTPFYSGAFLSTKVYILAGEEYSLTVGGDPVLYDGLGNPGEPAYGLYADGNFRPAPNNTTPVNAWASGQGAEAYYNWLALGGEGILDYEMGLGGITSDTLGQFLTRCPDEPQTIRSNEDFTLTWINRNYDTGVTGYMFPYAMRATLYNNGSQIGQTDYIATVANGGVWPICSTLPSPATGASGAENLLYSFKINAGDITTYTRTKFNIWASLDSPPYYGWQFGAFSPTADIFPNQVSAGLTPPTSGVSIGTEDDTWLTLSPTNATGSTEIAYKAMVAATGTFIDIEMSSSNIWGTDFPELELWGATGSNLTSGANWRYIDTFNATEDAYSLTYYDLSHTTDRKYFALGLRFKVATSSQYNQTLIGPRGYPSPSTLDCIQKWSLTSPLESTYDKICLALYPYDPANPCEVGPTAMSESICLTIDDTNCWGFEPIRFTWLNNLGGRDWYTFIKRNTNVQTAEREIFYQLPGYWSAATYSVQDNQPARYGNTVYNVKLENTWTASTDWITEEQSTWLRGMFASPHVVAYLPGRTQPVLVTITDGSYSVETYARQKLFQYFVSFTEAQPDVVQGF